jgi:hypothetical protein
MDDKQAPTAMQVLTSVGLISPEIKSKYISVKVKRHELMHEITRNPKVVESLRKQGWESHNKNLQLLISEMENIYLGWVSRFKEKFLKKGKESNQPMKLLSHIIVERVHAKLKNKLKGLSEEEARKLYNPEVLNYFVEVIGVKGKLSDQTK